jgi:glyceraldehyde 3-phosphate dehydrogenase
MPLRIAINGFGRIGRQITRIISAWHGCPLELVAINTMEEIGTAAHLLLHDSLYGRFPGEVEVDGNALCINGRKTIFLNEPNQAMLPWSRESVDLVIDSSGADLVVPRLHLQAGASRVLLTRSAAGNDITVCMGVNHTSYEPARHKMVSASSCTATGIAPVAKIVHERFIIEQATTCVIHSYTNQQHILDVVDRDLRLGRAAAVNMIPTQSSGTEELAKLFPELLGRISVMAVRVPTPVVHSAHFVARVRKRSNRDTLLAAFEEEAAGAFKGILGVNRKPLVSSDFRGNPLSTIVDAEFTDFKDELVSVFIWHDNEYAYSSRVVDIAAHIAIANQGERGPCTSY